MSIFSKEKSPTSPILTNSQKSEIINSNKKVSIAVLRLNKLDYLVEKSNMDISELPYPALFNILDNVTSFDIENIKKGYLVKPEKIYGRNVDMAEYDATMLKLKKKLEEPVFKEYIEKKILKEKEELVDLLNDQDSVATDDEGNDINVTVDSLGEIRIIEINNLEIPNPFILNHLTNSITIMLANNSINTIPNLDKLNSLTRLAIDNNQITKIENLEKLNLTHLNLSNNEIKEIEALDSLTKLKSLNLSGNLITEIKNLDKLTKLEELHLDDNHITELKNLEKLKNLKQLYISNNEIKELKNTGSVERIQILHNLIENLDVELLKKSKLKYIWIEDNLIPLQNRVEIRNITIVY
jgi:hypothetical protein